MSAPDVSGIAVTESLDTAAPSPPRRRRTTRGSIGRWVILALAAVYFIGPLLAAVSFTVQDSHGGISFDAYTQIFTIDNGQTGLAGALGYSLLIAVITIVITLGLMLPTQLLLHLRLPRMRPLVEIITLLPLVFPPVVLVVGISDVYAKAQPSGSSAGGFAFHVLRYIRDTDHPLLLALVYVILALPFVYRSIDAGIRSIDVQTLVEAARNLGAGWTTVLLRVLLPCLRTAVVNAAFLCFALVMGEYTIASILLYTKPFPVWLAQLPTKDDQVQVAVSVFSLLVVELILLLVGTLNYRSSRQRRA